MRPSAVALLSLVAAAVTFAGPARGPASADPVAPDLLYFSEKIAADLSARCATCHSDPEMGGMGGFLLQPFVDPRDPHAFGFQVT